MAEPPEFWSFVLTNFLMFGFGLFLTALSYYAYRADRSRQALRISTLGFGSLTIGGLVAPAYQIGVKNSYELAGRELLAVQSIEGFFLASGLGLLFFSIHRYSNGSRHGHVESAEFSED